MNITVGRIRFYIMARQPRVHRGATLRRIEIIALDILNGAG